MSGLEINTLSLRSFSFESNSVDYILKYTTLQKDDSEIHTTSGCRVFCMAGTESIETVNFSFSMSLHYFGFQEHESKQTKPCEKNYFQV